MQANALRLQRQAGNRATRSLARWDVTDLRLPVSARSWAASRA
jgi:hypothetical protein